MRLVPELTPILAGVACAALLGCYESHGLGSDAADAGGPAETCETERSPAAARYVELGCVPEAFELPRAGELDLSPGPCLGAREPTSSPFVLAGVWANLELEERASRACARVTRASEGSGLRVGTLLPDDSIVSWGLPFDEVDFEIEMVAIDACGNLVGGLGRGHR